MKDLKNEHEVHTFDGHNPKSNFAAFRTRTDGLNQRSSTRSISRPAEYKPHVLVRSSYSPDSLGELLPEVLQRSTHIVIAVPTTKLLDDVELILRSISKTLDDNPNIRRFNTESAMLAKHFGLKAQYETYGAPWSRSGKTDPIYAEHVAKVKNTEKWRRIEAKVISRRVFRAHRSERAQITIMVSNVLADPLRREELTESQAQVIFLNPGISDFQDYYQKSEEGISSKEQEIMERPDSKALPNLLQDIETILISDSELVNDLIEASYARQGQTLIVHMSEDNANSTPCHDHTNIKLIVTKLVSCKYRGLLPPVFDQIRKELWRGDAAFITDSLSSPNTINQVRSQVSRFDVPVLARISQPCPEIVRVVSKQLGLSFNHAKKPLIQDTAKCILRAVGNKNELVLLLDRYTKGCVTSLEELSGVDVVDIDLDKRAFKRLKLDEQEHAVAYKLHKTPEIVKAYSKSRPAYSRYIKCFEVEQNRLKLLLINVLVALTFCIRESDKHPKFTFDIKSLEGGVNSSDVCPWRTLAIRLLHKQMDQDGIGAVVTKYKKAIKQIDSRKTGRVV